MAQNSVRRTVDIPRALQNTLEAEGQMMRRRLGENYLGVMLGGSLIHGLGTPETSDIDYYIYTRAIDPGLADDIKEGSWSRLKQDRFAPCDTHPIRDLERRPIGEWLTALAIFSNLAIDVPSLFKLQFAALTLLKDSQVPEAEMREEFLKLTASDPKYVAEKFMENLAQEHIPEEMALDLSFNRPFMKEMVAMASDYMPGRISTYCRFPAEVAALFEK